MAILLYICVLFIIFQNNCMLNRIVTFGIFSNLFFCAYVLFKQPFEFYPPYIFIIAFLPLFVLKFKFPTFILKLLFPLLIFGLISIWTYDNTYPYFFKIYINVFISVLFYYYVFVAYEFDVEKLFGYYMAGCLFCLFHRNNTVSLISGWI